MHAPPVIPADALISKGRTPREREKEETHALLLPQPQRLARGQLFQGGHLYRGSPAPSLFSPHLPNCTKETDSSLSDPLHSPDGSVLPPALATSLDRSVYF